MTSWMIGLLASLALVTQGEGAVSPAGQSYELGELGSVFFGEGPSSGGAELRKDILFCTAEAHLDWRVDGDQIVLSTGKNTCAEADAMMSDAFSADCPDGWPDLQVGESRDVCWFTLGPVMRTE
ncbi:conserved hypothetical protein [Oceanicaulis sp. 350]|nr:conserved hypothetical protein [Oceanicaulis sp. 350]